MNALTASIALAVVQLCSGLIMAGVFMNTPSERCTRYWAWSGAVVAVGVVVAVVGYLLPVGPWRLALVLGGNTALFGGAVAGWSGLRHFYQRPAKMWGWALIVAHGAVFAGLLLADVGFTRRSFFTVGMMLVLFLLILAELARGISGPVARLYPRWSFGRGVGMVGVLLLSSVYVARLVLSVHQPALFELPMMSNLGVLLVYLIPLAGSMLLSAAWLLLYFERMVADRQRLATEDALTGTLNRRELVRAGEGMLHQALGQGQSMTLAFIDVDHFKRINDTFGHLVGDRVLSVIAAILKQNCRERDLLGRYGGEEFCAVFPGLDQTEARHIGERLVQAVRRHGFEHGAPVTISVGLVVLHPGQVQSWDALVHQADVALYKAKAEGRNDFRMAQVA